MRAIDADALIEFIKNRYEITWESDSYEGGIKDACVDILEKIENMPTIKPKRKTGKWVFHRPPDDWVLSLFTCDQCGYMNEGESRYCPECGADMKGEQYDSN